jgi:putative ABC transport system permease protein
LTAILFGLAPAITGTRVEIMDVLKGGGRNDSGNRAGSRLQGGLVVVQVALSLVLLTGAGLMINTLSRLHNIRLGFKPQNLLTVLCVMPPSQPAVTDLGIKPESRNAGSDKRRHYLANPAAVNFATRVAERLERVPGVKSASGVGIDFPFLIRPHFPFPFRMEEQVSLTPEERRTQSPWFSTITTNYFRTMGIPLVEGRAFDERDGENTPGVAIVSQAMAKKFWPRERTVIGKRITISPRSRPFEIVGLAADVRMSPKQDKEGQMYVPDVQFWEPSYSDLDLSQRVEFQFVLRTESEPAALAAAVRKAIEEVSPMQPVDRFLTMEEVLAKAFGPWSSTMVLLGLFAAVALLLSAIGIYGVMSYTVSRRKYEIGVRMALGASGGDVLRMMMKSGFLLAVAGVVAGSIAAYWLTRFIAGQLFEVKATDPLTFASGVGILMVVALVAAYVPARRATRLDPLAALRSE